MRYPEAHAAKSGSVPFMLRGPKSVRTVVATAVAGVVGLVPGLVFAQPAMAAPPTMAAVSALEGSDLVFTLTNPGTGAVTYDLAVTTPGPNAVASADYTALTIPSVTFATISSPSQTITIKTVDDSLYEANETLTLTATNAADSADTVSAVGTITDNDTAPSYTLTANPNPISESTSPHETVVTATLNARSGMETTIAMSSANGTALAGEDYTAIAGGTDIVIPAGDLTGTTTVAITADTKRDTAGTETFTVSGIGDNVSPKAQSATVSITDAQSVPRLTLSGGGAKAEGTDATFVVTADTASELPISFRWDSVAVTPATGRGTAVAGEDFGYPADRTVTIPAGSTNANIVIPMTTDSVSELDEDYAIELSAPTNAVLGSPVKVGGTVTDINSAPTVSVTPTSVTEENSGRKTVTFTATLSAKSGRTVTAEWGTSDNTAIAGLDYVRANGKLVFPAGSTSQTFTVDIIGDTIDEGTGETFKINLSAPSSEAGSPSLGVTPVAQITITDDDAKPTITFGNLSVNEGNDTSAVLVPLKLSNASDHPIAFDLTPSAVSPADPVLSSAVGSGDYSLLNTTFTVPAGMTSGYAVVMVNGDTIYEPNESVDLTATAQAGTDGADYLTAPTTATARLTLVNDDKAPNLEVNSVTGQEGETVAVTGTVTGQSQTMVGVTVYFAGKAMDGKKAADDKDFVNPGVTPVWIYSSDIPGTVLDITNVELVNDTAAEPAETVLATGTGVGNVGSVTDGVITIAASDGGTTPTDPGDPGDPTKPTLSAPAKVVGAVAVPLSGKAAANTTVELWGAPMGDDEAELKYIGSVQSDANGNYKFSRWIGQGHRFATQADGINSDEVMVSVQQNPVLAASSPARGKLALTVTGNPRAAGQTVIVQRWVGGKWVNSWRGTTGNTNQWKATINAPAGSAHTLRAFIAGYTPDGLLPGYSVSRSVTIRR
jgi:hypothetical protein